MSDSSNGHIPLELAFALDMRADVNPCLRDHVALGRPHMPIGAYFDLVYAVAQDRLGLDRIAIDGFVVSSPLVADGASHARIVFREVGGRWVFAVESEDGGAPRVHANGAIAPLDASKRTRSVGDDVESRVALTPAAREALDDCSLHPASVSAMITSALALAGRHSGDPRATYAARAIAHVEIFGPIDGSPHATLTELRSSDGDAMTFDVTLVNESDEVVVSFRGLEVARVGAPDLVDSQTEPDAATIAAHPSAADDTRAIAIVGYSGRFPKARDRNEFWRNLAAGVDCITEVPRSRWNAAEYYDPDGRAPNTTASKWGGFVDGVDLFDPGFFGISPMEAESMDPQQRLFLEEAYLAIEDAGYRLSDVRATKCGVFVGASMSDYETTLMRSGVETSAQAFTGMSEAILAARIAYFLDLKGPAVSIDTACSSSLVAINVACQSLASGESDMAIAGGVFVMLTPKLHIKMSQSGMLSKTGKCRTFDAAADGTVLGEAAGAVVLKRLADAIRDRDPIHGILRGYGVNQDGKTNGITAPNPAAQEALEGDVYDRFAIDPRTISYVETHGTGTGLGDPAEVDALTNAFRRHTSDSQFCVIGAVKANIGHATLAAGVAGVVKVLLALRHRQIPPSVHFATANPRIDVKTGPFRVCTELAPWATDRSPRRAAVSAFSFSGTNAHVVIEEGRATPIAPRVDAPCYLFALSGKSEASLREYARRLAAWTADSDEPLADVAYTLLARREHFRVRRAIVAASYADLERALQAIARGEGTAVTTSVAEDSKARGAELIESLANDLPGVEEHGAMLCELAACFEAGHTLPWSEWLAPASHCTVSLPGYAFEQRRYWMDEPTTNAQLSPMLLAKAPEPAQRAPNSVFRWMRDEWVARSQTATRAPAMGTLLVIAPEEARFAALARRAAEASPGLHVVRAAAQAPITHAIYDATNHEDVFHEVSALLGELARSTSPSTRFVFLHATEPEGPRPELAAIGALLRTAMAENPRLDVRSIGLSPAAALRFDAIAIDELLGAAVGVEVSHVDDGVRRAKVLVDAEPARGEPSISPARDGAYLITGGMGAIGLSIAKHVAAKYGARLVLTGRTATTEAYDANIAEIERLGGAAKYFACDVSSEADVRRMLVAAREAFGPIRGVYHCAGNLRSIFAKKTREEIDRVLAPKTRGTIAIDRATADDPLDFIALFSSISATFGNVGQGDYAYANAFLDAFAVRREARRLAGRCRGKTVSIAWPLWREGGARVDRGLEKLVEDTMGMRAIGTAEALDVLERGLGFAGPAFVAAYGEPVRLARIIEASASDAQPHVEQAEAGDASEMEAWLTGQVALVLKVDPDALAPEDDFGDYGLDSIILTGLVNRINEQLGVELTPALVFEHRNIRTCARYLAARRGVRPQ